LDRGGAMKCIILGAGSATRLYPLTRHRPKPLLSVGGRPIIERLLERVAQVPQLEQVYVVSNHRFAEHYGRWLREYAGNVPIALYDDLTNGEEDRLGAVGDIQFVLQRASVTGDLLVVAGDNLMEFSLAPFAAAARAWPVTVGLKDLGSVRNVGLYGAATLDEQGRIVEFEEKPPRPRTSLISLGLYFFRADHVAWIGKFLQEGRERDQPGYLIQWLVERVPVHGFVVEGDWFDIGDIDSYNRANDRYSA
jgi:glucose-1-phosphate thymidylyltransferase